MKINPNENPPLAFLLFALAVVATAVVMLLVENYQSRKTSNAGRFQVCPLCGEQPEPTLVVKRVYL